MAKKTRQHARGLNAALTIDSKTAAKANAVESIVKPKAYPPRDMSKVDCHNCGKFGHFSRDCRLPRKDKKPFHANASRSDRNHKRGNNNGRTAKQNANLASEGTRIVSASYAHVLDLQQNEVTYQVPSLADDISSVFSSEQEFQLFLTLVRLFIRVYI